jgi:4-hydroxy-3-polyprenylbenzoate decarboxylase
MQEAHYVTQPRRIIVAITGASGAIFGIRTLEVLGKIADVESHLVMSDGARATIAYETGYSVDEVKGLADVVHSERNLGASISSGSFQTEGMLVAPCSIKTLSGIANSYDDNLIIRAADVVLKERRKLVLLVRETPLHVGHLKLMVQASENGAVILPPMPSFYHRPVTVDDVVDHIVGKALDQFGIDAKLYRRWQGSVQEGKQARERRESGTYPPQRLGEGLPQEGDEPLTQDEDF